MKIRVMTCAAVAGALLATMMPGATHADDNAAEEQLVQQVQRSAPVEAPVATPTRVTDGTVVVESEATQSVVTIAESSNDETAVEVSAEESGSVGLALPAQAEVADGVLVDSGSMVYSGDEVDVVVQPIEDGSVRINTVISDAAAPHEFTYDLDLPSGAVLEPQADGSIVILDGDQWIGGVAAPWAVDAAGKAVPTRYEVGEDGFTQVVEADAQTRYPVVADPWLGKALVSKTNWKATYSGRMLQVHLTWWGRYGAFATVGGATYFLLRDAFWTEVKDKTRGTRENTTSMRDQLYCHVDVVRLRDPKKATWNLEPWRPNVSYVTMLAKGCNP